MLKKLGLTLLIAGLSVGAILAQDPTLVPTTVPAPDASTSQATVIGGDEDALRAFILRYIVGNSQGQNVNVMVGELPTELPFTIETPPASTLYGTIARTNQSASYYDITLDVPDSPQAVIDFYKQSFAGSDWQITNESVPEASGFGGASNGYATFCYQQGVATLNINAYNDGRGISNVNVNVQTPGDIYICTPSQGPVTDPVMGLIPSLALPEEVVVTANSGGGFSYYQPNGRSYSLNAVLESSRPLVDIANDYNAQLAAAGWQQISTENSERTALSTWSVADETGKTWHGSLLIVADNDPNTYNALIYVEE